MEKKNKINTEVKVENESNLLTDEELGQAQGGIAAIHVPRDKIKNNPRGATIKINI